MNREVIDESETLEPACPFEPRDIRPGGVGPVDSGRTVIPTGLGTLTK